MLQRFFLPVVLVLLAYGFWVSPTFKEVSAGVAIFLFGMLFLEQGFQTFSGGALERLLKKATGSRFKSLLFGVVSTTLMQSSSLVSIIAISFISAGLITLAAGIAIVFGANLGTTTGAWLIAGFGFKVKIAAYALPMLVFSIVLIFQKSKTLKGIGYVLAGLGFLFLGIHYIKEGFDTLGESIDLSQYAMSGLLGVLFFTLIGTVATVIMQSSHATLVLIITALAAQQVSYENALALAIGSNIGTTISAILGSLGANQAGKRLALAHLVFNLCTAIVAIILLSPLQQVVEWLAQVFAIPADDYTLKLALFHSVFNVIGLVLMLPWLDRLSRWLMQVIPEVRIEVDTPMYLNEAATEFPESALEAVRMESLRVYDAAIRLIATGLGLRQSDFEDIDKLPELIADSGRLHSFNYDAMYKRHVKSLYGGIIAFIGSTKFPRNDENNQAIPMLRSANQGIVQAIKDAKHLQKNLLLYLGGRHKPMNQAYNAIRLMIATTLAELQAIRSSELDDLNADSNVMASLHLDTLKLQIDENQNKLYQGMTDSIRRHAITSAMASSLLNDIGYAHSICDHLVTAAQAILAVREREMMSVADDLYLDRDERDRITRENPAHIDAEL